MPYKQVAFKVEPKEYENFEAFARRLGLPPYTMMRLLVESWASAEELMRRLEEGTTSEPEAFAELGKLIERIKTIAKLNGVFGDIMKRVYDHYGVKLPVAGKTKERQNGRKASHST